MVSPKKEWNKRNPEKRKAAQKRNYARGNIHNRNRFSRWQLADELLVMASTKTDRELSKILGRSVQAIQIRRSKLKKEATES